MKSVISEDAEYQHFKEMLESIPGGGMCVVNDLDLSVVFINDVLLEMLGYTREEFYAVSEGKFVRVIHSDDRQDAFASYHRSLTDSSYFYSYRAVKKDGGTVWLRESNKMTVAPDGRELLLCVFSDVSDEARLREELAFSTRQLSEIVDTAAALATGQEFESSMNTALERIREYYSAERAYVCEFDWDSSMAAVTFETREEGAPEREEDKNFPLEDIRCWFDRAAGDSCIIIRTDELGRAQTAEKARLLARNAELAMSVPIRADGRLMGLVGVDNPKSSGEDPSLLVILSYFISSELLRFRSQLRISDSEKSLVELIKNAPGGVCHYRMSGGRIIPITVSEGLAEMVGLTVEEELQNIGRDYMTNVLPEDKEALQAKLQKLTSGETSISASYRLFNNAQKEYNWVKLAAISVPCGDGDYDIYASYLNVDAEIKSRKDAEERFKRVSDQIKAANRNTMSVNLTKNTIDMRSSSLVDDWWGFKGVNEPHELFRLMCSSSVHEADRDLFYHTFNYKELMESYKAGDVEKTVELRLAEGDKWRWWRIGVRLAVKPGNSDLLSIFWAEDINKEKLRLSVIECMAATDYEYVSVINAAEGSYSMFALSEQLKIKPVTESGNYAEDSLSSIELSVLPEDRELAKRSCALEKVVSELEDSGEYSYTVRLKAPDGSVKVSRLKYVWLERESGLILSMNSDITQDVLEQQRTSEALNALLSAAGQNKMAVWTYDFETGKLSFSDPGCDVNKVTGKGLLYPGKYVEQGFVHPEDAEKFEDMLRRTHAGEPVVSGEIRYIIEPDDPDNCRWERTVFSTVTDKNGKPCKAYGSSQDITEQKHMQLRFDREMERLKMVKSETDFPAYFIFNATKDILIEHEPGGFPVQTVRAGSPMSECRKISRSCGASERDSELFRDCLDRELILSTFRDGGSQIVREYRRPGKEENTVIWARTAVNIAQDPDSADIVCFCYTIDITEERTREAVLDAMLSDEYEFIMYIDLQNDSFKTFANKYGGTLLPADRGCYSSMISRFVKDCYVEEDIQKTLRLISPEGIKKQLQTAESFELLGRVIDEDGSISVKKLCCGNIDKENSIAYCYRVDVTSLFDNEQEQADVISSALEEAERANSAKSRFIANMSRDMRTPLYEVLGLTKLTLEKSRLPAEARENLEQVAKSAAALSDIIDEVLDLSKIENGEITLHYEKTDMAEVFGELISEGEQLAETESVRFVSNVERADWREVMLDRLRVWQIFSKLISTAVKLSKIGGEVHFTAESTGVYDGEAEYRFTITDSAAEPGGSLGALLGTYLERDSELSDDFDVSGMAMPLVSSLVEQMGGSLSVESNSDGSSEVAVYLSFLTPNSEKERGGRGENYSKLRGKRVLLVEDHPTNVLVATKVLESRGILVETADNGQMALSKFEASPSGYYDAILMDVRMPVMNGHEATRHIRASGRPDAESVPIIAMTANAFDDDVRESYDAGMSEHLSKPIEPKKLCEALYRCIVK